MSFSPLIYKIQEFDFGVLKIASFEDELVCCDWQYRKQRDKIDQRIQTYLNKEFEKGTSTIIERSIHQLLEFESGDRKQFDIPLKFCGSDFQIRVWEQLYQIPYGQTVSYLELATKMGDRNAIRAVAGANGANAISIIVPCHRVIGSDGELTGYAGGISVKKKLLNMEMKTKQLTLDL